MVYFMPFINQKHPLSRSTYFNMALLNTYNIYLGKLEISCPCYLLDLVPNKR